MPRPSSLVELLQDLVAIPSVNPSGQPGTDQTGEQAVAEYVAGFLRNLGGEVELDMIEPGRPNVVAHFYPEEKETRRFAFAPHLDTVSVRGMTIDPFDPVVRDGKLFGRGSCDTKGPMAAALWALKSWATSAKRITSSTHWTFFGLMGEEAGNDGALAVAKQNLTADLVLVLEPTDLAVVTAHKGTIWLELITSGLACHGSTPDLGRNAIKAMAEIINKIDSKLLPQFLARHPAHPLMGPVTLNVGTIAGGSKINIVPDFCRMEIDARILPGVEAEPFRQWMEDELRAVAPELQIKVERYSRPLPPQDGNPWVEQLGKLARGKTTAPWFSDAAVLAHPGCPAVCVGPGSIAQAHTKDEFIALSELEEGYRFFCQWINST